MPGSPPSLKLLPAEEARRIMAGVAPVDVERVPLRRAGGRVLAEALSAPEDLPPAARSVMDGYAVRAAEVAAATAEAPAVLRLAGVVPMGGVFAGRVEAGELVGISTGGFLPAGADAVVMIEHTEPRSGEVTVGDRVRIFSVVAAGANLIAAGEDLHAGAAVLTRGRRLRPQDLAALATFGVSEVLVHRRPRIALLSTGNELCEPTERPGPGQVRDVNQAVLGAQIESAGCAVSYGGIVRDRASDLRTAISLLLPGHDGLILSGGSSVGVKDVSAEALGNLDAPGIVFHGIDIRPGKPTLFALAGQKPILGMPGFPTSSKIVIDAFVRPMLWRLGGEGARDPWPAHCPARLGRAYTSARGREDYLRVRLTIEDGQRWAHPLAGGSAAISNVLLADGLVRVDADLEGLARGDSVEVWLY
jgi:molybdopterin molybdotransferase